MYSYEINAHWPRMMACSHRYVGEQAWRVPV